ncbi:MAG: hypothetical protein HY553_19745 [Elusimicrobia bacterium]|nr:hypothetical protein [Elusimicrobiota bacterium]
MRAILIATALIVARPALGAAISDDDALAVSYRVWQNEAGGSSRGLTHWNKGEDFASLGIGHFIWYPAGKRGPFEESFPKLLAFMEAEGVELPAWLRGRPACPWPDRQAFRRDMDAPRLEELRNFLTSTLGVQARFMAARLERSLPAMLEAAPDSRRELVRERFERLMSQPQGVYALIDYVNFKGEGVSPTERYNGKGWGLLQVLLDMRGEGRAANAAEFARSARRILTRRVKNSPPERGEATWLAVWRRRVRTYA